MTRTAFTFALTFLCGTAAATPPSVAIFSPCERRGVACRANSVKIPRAREAVSRRPDQPCRSAVYTHSSYFFHKICYNLESKRRRNESKRKFDRAKTVRAQVDTVTYRTCLHGRDAVCRESVGAGKEFCDRVG